VVDKKVSPVGKVETAVEGPAVTLQPGLDVLWYGRARFLSVQRPPVMGLSGLPGGVNAAIVGSAPEVRGARGRALRDGLGACQAGAAPRAETTEDHHDAHDTTRLHTRGGKSDRALSQYA
jgi:hypothetical protein